MSPGRFAWPCLGAVALLGLAAASLGCAPDSHRPGPIGRAPILVAPDGSGDHPDIASALGAAVDGDTILLADGT